jgi:hypothetical protein
LIEKHFFELVGDLGLDIAMDHHTNMIVRNNELKTIDGEG